MSRNIVAVGLNAVRQSVEILGSVQFGASTGLAMGPGAQWGGDRMLLSVGVSSVKFVAGSTLYEQDQEGFLLDESRAGIADSRQASWLRGLSPYEMPFCMGLAAALAPAWTGTYSTCPFLEQFSSFYRNHRTRLELAARDLHYVLDGLYTLRRWPALFESLMETMGERASGSLPKGVSQADLGAFLGRLLMRAPQSRLTLARLPQGLRDAREQQTPEAEEWSRVPQYRRTMEHLERSAERVAPLLEQLRDAL